MYKLTQIFSDALRPVERIFKNILTYLYYSKYKEINIPYPYVEKHDSHTITQEIFDILWAALENS